MLCPKLVVVKTEPKEEEASNSYKIKSDQTKPYQVKSDQTKAYQTRPSNTPVNKSAKSSSRKALESCLLSSSKVKYFSNYLVATLHINIFIDEYTSKINVFPNSRRNILKILLLFKYSGWQVQFKENEFSKDIAA